MCPGDGTLRDRQDTFENALSDVWWRVVGIALAVEPYRPTDSRDAILSGAGVVEESTSVRSVP
jgi:hypothetical protein